MSDGIRKTRKVRARRVNLELVNRRLQSAMNEDSKWILDSVGKGKLSKHSVESLDKYLKLIKILKAMDDSIPLEELEKLAKKANKEPSQSE